MTVIDKAETTTPEVVVRTSVEERRATIIGIVLMALAAVVMGVFAFGVPPDASSTSTSACPPMPSRAWHGLLTPASSRPSPESSSLLSVPTASAARTWNGPISLSE